MAGNWLSAPFSLIFPAASAHISFLFFFQVFHKVLDGDRFYPAARVIIFVHTRGADHMHACTHMFTLFPAQATPTSKMAWKSTLLALLSCCSNASAFAMPLGPRAELNTMAAQLPSGQARPSTTCNNTPPNMRYIAMNRFDESVPANPSTLQGVLQ